MTNLIFEETECDFKVALEVKKPKSWLKSVSAYANGIGGRLTFGVDDDKNIVGLANAQKDAEDISRLIQERIVPTPDFILSAMEEEGKELIVLRVFPGRNTPYYYKFDGVMQAYIRVGNESTITPDYILNQLILKGMNNTFDSLHTEYLFENYSFSKLKERYNSWTGSSFEEKLFDSFELIKGNKLTNAGALFADDSPIRNSRLFCVRWNGLDKAGGIVDALDSAEYKGSLIILLNEGLGFIKRNSKISWKKTENSRIELPDYSERSVFEALVNAIIHRDYLIQGGEIHIDIYDDRLTITSPGGMIDGTRIQERDLESVSSVRRNPIIADVFSRLGLMERQGSGFKKILDAYSKEQNFNDKLTPIFYSDAASFQVILYNLNYNDGLEVIDEGESEASIEVSDWSEIKKKLNEPALRKLYILLESIGMDRTFTRRDIVGLCSITPSVASKFIRKIKNLSLIERAINAEKKNSYTFNYQTLEYYNLASNGEIVPNLIEMVPNLGKTVPFLSETVPNLDGTVSNFSEKPAFDFEKPAFESQKPAFESEEVSLNPKKPAFDFEKPAFDQEKVSFEPEKPAFESEEVSLESEEVSFERRLLELNVSKSLIKHALCLFDHYKFDVSFKRSDVIRICEISPSSAGDVLRKFKELGIVENEGVTYNKKYKFKALSNDCL